MDAPTTSEAVPEELNLEAPAAKTAPAATGAGTPEEVKPETPPAKTSESKA